MFLFLCFSIWICFFYFLSFYKLPIAYTHNPGGPSIKRRKHYRSRKRECIDNIILYRNDNDGISNDVAVDDDEDDG